VQVEVAPYLLSHLLDHQYIFLITNHQQLFCRMHHLTCGISSFWFVLDCLHGSRTWTGLSGHWRLFVLFFFFFVFFVYGSTLNSVSLPYRSASRSCFFLHAARFHGDRVINENGSGRCKAQCSGDFARSN